MAVKADEKYTATVMSAELIESVLKGTPGIQITFQTADGDIDHTIWLTPKTVERARKDLIKLGATDEGLSTGGWEYLENIGEVLRAHQCRITTHEETYNEKTRVKVQWINSLDGDGSGVAKATPKTAKAAATMFAEAAAIDDPLSEPGSPDALVGVDDDLPF